MVYGYSSSAGVLVREAGAIELLHLGLDRFKEAKRSSSTAEEDGFCKRLRQLELLGGRVGLSGRMHSSAREMRQKWRRL